MKNAAACGVERFVREGAPFDLAFIDANQGPAYDGSYEACLRLVRPGGVIVLDNMPWSGTVALPGGGGAPHRALRALNLRLHADERVDPVLLTVGDGLSLVRRRPRRRDMARTTRRTVLKAGGLGALALLTRGRAQAPATLAERMTLAANRFLVGLSPAQCEGATFPFADAERTRWHWTTPSGFPRAGLPLAEMTPPQRDLALALLRSGSSDAGYTKNVAIMNLQRALQRTQGDAATYDPDLYFVSVFGTPGRGAWGWRFEGHHLSRQFTVVGDAVSVTPFFLGAWPTRGPGVPRAMPREEDAARELIRSLTGRGRRAALFQEEPLFNHVTGNAARVTPLAPVGLPVRDLSSAEQARVLEILQTYLGTLPGEVARAHLARVRGAGLEGVRFGWAGPLESGEPHYYRLQGPTFLLEFDNTRNAGFHIHSVWRDFAGDFGANLPGVG